MNSKVLVATILLAGAALFTVLGEKNSQVSSLEKLALIDEGGISNVTSFSVTTESRSINLLLKDGGWVIGSSSDFPVDGAKVANFFDKLNEGKIHRRVSRVKSKWEELGLNPGKEVSLQDASGKVLSKFYLGNSRPSGGQYVRFDSDGEVSYMLSANLDVSPDEGSWQLKSLLAISSADIKSLDYAGKVLLSRKDAKSDFTVQGVDEKLVNLSEAKNPHLHLMPFLM